MHSQSQLSLYYVAPQLNTRLTLNIRLRSTNVRMDMAVTFSHKLERLISWKAGGLNQIK